MTEFLAAPALGTGFGAWWPYLFVFVAGFLATDIWRWAGVAIGGGLRDDSPLLAWIRAVATALVAGVIAKLMLEATGSLAQVPVWLRLLSGVSGLAVYFATRRNLGFGVAAGEVVLLGGTFLGAAVTGAG